MHLAIHVNTYLYAVSIYALLPKKKPYSLRHAYMTFCFRLFNLCWSNGKVLQCPDERTRHFERGGTARFLQKIWLQPVRKACNRKADNHRPAHAHPKLHHAKGEALVIRMNPLLVHEFLKKPTAGGTQA
jgi:hypothetical protein